MSWEILIGVLALVISLISLTLVVVFYFKSDKLYKDMLTLVAEIRVYSETMYKDTVGMVKDGWKRIWDERDKDQIADSAKEQKDTIKAELSQEIKKGLEVIKGSDVADGGELKQKVTELESSLSHSMDKMFRRMEEIDRSLIQQMNLTEIDRLIIEFARTNARFALMTLFVHIRKTNHFVSPDEVAKRLHSLREQGLLSFVHKDGMIIIDQVSTQKEESEP